MSSVFGFLKACSRHEASHETNWIDDLNVLRENEYLSGGDWLTVQMCLKLVDALLNIIN